MRREGILCLVISVFLLSPAIAVAAEYTGDGTYTAEVGDRLTADNGYYIEVEGISEPELEDGSTRKQVDFRVNGGYQTSLYEGETEGFPLAVTGGQDVIEVGIESVNIDEKTASITITSLEEEETPTEPGEEEDGETNDTSDGETHEGDGEYELSVGDRIVSDSGYSIELTGTVHDEMVRISVENPSGRDVEMDSPFLSSGGEKVALRELGLTVRLSDVDTGSGTATMKVLSAVRIQLLPGWNLFSVPVQWKGQSCDDAQCYGPGTNGLKVIENTCGSLDEMTIWHWDNGEGEYVRSLPRAPHGYWVKTNSVCHITFGGERFTIEGTELGDGWNQIGAPTGGVEFDSVKGDCNVAAGPFQYDPRTGSWTNTDVLEQGEGHFIKVDGSCTLGGSGGPPPIPE